MRFLVIVFLVTVIAGCSSSPKGRWCEGEVSTLQGEPRGRTAAWIADQDTHFTLTRDKISIDSGLLTSSDPGRYLPSAVTLQGYYAQRLTADRFRLIDAPLNLMVTWQCPPFPAGS